jgi:hypothetical protein
MPGLALSVLPIYVFRLGVLPFIAVDLVAALRARRASPAVGGEHADQGGDGSAH